MLADGKGHHNSHEVGINAQRLKGLQRFHSSVRIDVRSWTEHRYHCEYNTEQVSHDGCDFHTAFGTKYGPAKTTKCEDTSFRVVSNCWLELHYAFTVMAFAAELPSHRTFCLRRNRYTAEISELPCRRSNSKIPKSTCTSDLATQRALSNADAVTATTVACSARSVRK